MQRHHRQFSSGATVTMVVLLFVLLPSLVAATKKSGTILVREPHFPFRSPSGTTSESSSPSITAVLGVTNASGEVNTVFTPSTKTSPTQTPVQFHVDLVTATTVGAWPVAIPSCCDQSSSTGFAVGLIDPVKRRNNVTTTTTTVGGDVPFDTTFERLCLTEDPVKFRGSWPSAVSTSVGDSGGSGLAPFGLRVAGRAPINVTATTTNNENVGENALLCHEVTFESVHKTPVDAANIANDNADQLDDGEGGLSITFSMRVGAPSPSPSSSSSAPVLPSGLLFTIADNVVEERDPVGVNATVNVPAAEAVLGANTSKPSKRTSVLVQQLEQQLETIIQNHLADNPTKSSTEEGSSGTVIDASFPKRKVHSWLNDDGSANGGGNFAVYAFVYFHGPTATMFSGSADPQKGLVLLSWGPLTQLLPSSTKDEEEDASWHAVALVMTKASETNYVVQLWIDGDTDFDSQNKFVCTMAKDEFLAPVKSTPAASSSKENPAVVEVMDVVRQRVFTKGALILGSSSKSPQNASISSSSIELFNLRLHAKALSQFDLIQEGATWMEDNLMVPSVGALSIGVVMSVGSFVVVVTVVMHICSGELSDDNTLTEDDFSELENGGAADSAKRALNPGTLRKVLTPAKSAQFVSQFRVVRQLSSIIPPVIDVFQTQALLLRGFTFSWPMKFRVPMAFITVPFALNFNLPTFDVAIPSYAPLLCLLVLALGCLALGFYFGEQDNRKFRNIMKGMALESKTSVSLGQLLIKSALSSVASRGDKKRKKKVKHHTTQNLHEVDAGGNGDIGGANHDNATIHGWAVAIVRNGWALDASALRLLIEDLDHTEAKVIASVLGDKPLDAVEAEIRRFSLLKNLKWTASAVVDFSAALAASTPGTDVCALARAVNVRLGERDGAELLVSLRQLLLDGSTSSNKKSGSAKKTKKQQAEELNKEMEAMMVEKGGHITALSEELIEAMRDVCAADEVAVPSETQLLQHCADKKVSVKPLLRYVLEPESSSNNKGGSLAVLDKPGELPAHGGNENYVEFLRLVNHVSKNDNSGWTLPTLLCVKKSMSASSAASAKPSDITVLKFVTIAKTAPRTFALRSKSHGAYILNVEWMSRLRCPYHNARLILAEEKHYRSKNPDGTRSLICSMTHCHHFKEVADLEPCRGDDLLVCPAAGSSSHGCRYAVCGGCAESVQSIVSGHVTDYATQWQSFKDDPSAFIALISFLGLQYVYLPATEDSLMILGCHMSVRCEFPDCYKNMSTAFVTSVAVALAMFLVLSIGVPAYWLYSIMLRRRQVKKVIHSPAQWEELLSRDQTILSNLYNKYEMEFIAAEPILLVVRNCALVAAVAFTKPDSMLQLILVSLVTLLNALFIAVTAPFLDGWVDVLTKADLAHNALQLAFVSYHQWLTTTHSGQDNTMVYPMFATVAVFAFVYALVFYKTVIRTFLDSRKATAAAELQRSENSWLDVLDASKRAERLEGFLKDKKKLYGKKHFQVALTMSHVAASQLEDAKRDQWRCAACTAIDVALRKECKVLSKRLAKKQGTQQNKNADDDDDEENNNGGGGAEGFGPLDMYSFGGLRSHEVHPSSWAALSQSIRSCPDRDIRSSLFTTLLKIIRLSKQTHRSEALCVNAITLLNSVTGTLKEEDLSRSNLSGAQLTGHIDNVSFEKADLSNCNFRGSTLQNVNLVHAQLGGSCIFGSGSEPLLPQFHIDFPIKGDDSYKNMALSPDDTQLAVFGVDHAVHILDAMIGQRSFALDGHEKRVVSGEWSPCRASHLFVCADATNHLYAWDVQRKQQVVPKINILGNHGGGEKSMDTVGVISFSPNGSVLAVGLDSKLHIFSVSIVSSSSVKKEKATPMIVEIKPFRVVDSDIADNLKPIFHPDGISCVVNKSYDTFMFHDMMAGGRRHQQETDDEDSEIAFDHPVPTADSGRAFTLQNMAFAGVSCKGQVLFSNEEAIQSTVMLPSLPTTSPSAHHVTGAVLSHQQKWRTELSLPAAGTADIIFTPDGHQVASVNKDGSISMYDTTTGMLTGSHQLEVDSGGGGGSKNRGTTKRKGAEIQANPCFSLDGRFLFVCVSRTQLKQDGGSGMETIKSIQKFDLRKGGGGTATSSGGEKSDKKTDSSGQDEDDEDQNRSLADVSSAVSPATKAIGASPQHDSRIRHVKRLGKTNWVITNGTDSTSRVWDCSTGRLIRLIEHPEKNIDNFDCDEMGKRMVFAYTKQVSVYDVASCTMIATCHVDPLECPGGVSICPSGVTVVVSTTDEDEKPFYVFQLQAAGNTSSASAVLSIPDTAPRSIASGNNMSTMYQLQQTGIAEPPKGKISSDESIETIAILPNGRQVVTGHYEGSVYLFELRDNGRNVVLLRCLKQRINDDHGVPQLLRCCAKNALFIATEENNCVERYDTINFSKSTVTFRHRKVDSMSVSADGSLLTTASTGRDSADGMKIWSIADGRVVEQFTQWPELLCGIAAGPGQRKTVTSSAFNADGSTYAVVNGSHIALFRRQGAECPLAVASAKHCPHMVAPNAVMFTAFNHPVDSTWIVQLFSPTPSTSPSTNTVSVIVHSTEHPEGILHYRPDKKTTADIDEGGELLSRLITSSEFPVHFINCIITKPGLLKVLERMLTAAKAQHIELAPSSRVAVGDVREDYTDSENDDDDDSAGSSSDDNDDSFSDLDVDAEIDDMSISNSDDDWDDEDWSSSSSSSWSKNADSIAKKNSTSSNPGLAATTTQQTAKRGGDDSWGSDSWDDSGSDQSQPRRNKKGENTKAEPHHPPAATVSAALGNLLGSLGSRTHSLRTEREHATTTTTTGGLLHEPLLASSSSRQQSGLQTLFHREEVFTASTTEERERKNSSQRSQFEKVDFVDDDLL